MYKQLKTRIVIFAYNIKKYALIIIILFRFFISTTTCSFLIVNLLEYSIICYITKIDYLNCVD